MKLPKYDNSPPPGSPLYNMPTDGDGDWPVMKWAAGIVGLLFVLGFIAYATIDAFRNFF